MKKLLFLGITALCVSFCFSAAAQDHTILFEFNSHKIPTSASKVLDSISTLPNIYTKTIELIGHTDSVGSNSYNNNLAHNRVQQVAKYLTQKGVHSQQITTAFHGENQLTSNNQDLNRRVEIWIKKRQLTAEEKQLRTFQRSMLPAPQRHTLSAHKATLLTGINGTQLHIPAHAFQSAKGHPITGKVTILFTEYIHMNEFIAAGLTTTSNGQLLSSAGMVKVQAFSNGAPVQLAHGKSITLTFTNEDTNGFTTFYGQRTNQGINWINRDSTDEIPTQKKSFSRSYTLQYGSSVGIDYCYNIYNKETNTLHVFTYYTDRKVRHLTTSYKQKRQIKKYTWYNRAQADSLRKALINQLPQETYVSPQNNAIAITSQRLGYINCDKYVNNADAIAMQLNARIKTTDVKILLAGLVFYDINSYLRIVPQKNHINFNMKIPPNSRPKLLVIGMKNNEPFWYFEEFTPNAEVTKSIAMAPTTFDLIKEQL